MLKGLEVSEIRLKDLEETFRIDAEYFLHNHLAIEARLLELGSRPISKIADISDGNHLGVSEEFVTNGVPYYRGGDVHGFFIENSNPACFVDRSVYDAPAMQRAHLKCNDVLITIVGAVVGNVAIVSADTPAMCSCKIAILRPKFEKDASALALFLQGRYGKSQIYRLVRGSVKPGFNLDDFDKFYIPEFGEAFKDQLSRAVAVAKERDFKSQKVMADAESQLLTELGFASWRPVDGGVSAKSFSETVAAGRIDAEYFQPKFDKIEARIRELATDVLCAADVLIEGLCKSDDEKVERYIELADIGSSGTVESCMQAEFADLPSRARQRVTEGQVIVSSIEGSLKSCALITSEFDGALCSTGFHRFQSDKINPETLLLLFKSWPIQELLKRGCSGTILSGISADSLASVSLPILSQRIQSSLADKVRESFRLRNESKRLLDLAKSAVELAIENGEDAAMKQLSKGKV